MLNDPCWICFRNFYLYGQALELSADMFWNPSSENDYEYVLLQFSSYYTRALLAYLKKRMLLFDIFANHVNQIIKINICNNLSREIKIKKEILYDCQIIYENLKLWILTIECQEWAYPKTSVTPITVALLFD